MDGAGENQRAGQTGECHDGVRIATGSDAVGTEVGEQDERILQASSEGATMGRLTRLMTIVMIPFVNMTIVIKMACRRPSGRARRGRCGGANV